MLIYYAIDLAECANHNGPLVFSQRKKGINIALNRSIPVEFLAVIGDLHNYCIKICGYVTFHCSVTEHLCR